MTAAPAQGLAVWGWQFIAMDFAANPWPIGDSFMHRINLVFHEAGHVLRERLINLLAPCLPVHSLKLAP